MAKALTEEKNMRTAQKTKKADTVLNESLKKAAIKTKKAKTSSAKNSTKKESASSTLKTNKTSSKKNIDTEKKKKVNTNKKASLSTRKTSSTKNKKINHLEYYDLPYRYNETIIKLLAQTPNRLFVYWDISDNDRESLKKEYGDNFFEATYPILIIHNIDKNYTFELPINDFANSWYFDVEDSKCKYYIELGRKFINNTTNNSRSNNNHSNDYIYITSSNTIEAPNNHILFEKKQNMVYYKNVKTDEVTSKNIENLSILRNMGKIYHFYNLYKKLYPNENIDNFKNPSSSIY